MNRRSEQKRVTDLARDRDCTIRVVGVCNFNRETTVPCHFRLSALSGLGYIPDALHVAWGCSACHAYVDTHKDAETQLAFAHGVLRTQAILIREGVISWQ